MPNITHPWTQLLPPHRDEVGVVCNDPWGGKRESMRGLLGVIDNSSVAVTAIAVQEARLQQEVRSIENINREIKVRRWSYFVKQ